MQRIFLAFIVLISGISVFSLDLSFGLSQAEAKGRCGRASWYAMRSQTASGEQMNPDKYTAAHPSYRFGTKVRVTNQRNGRSVIVRINDRGPFTKGRIIDVSRIAARRLGFIRAGHTSVCLKRIG